jgi:hypothetical protein
MNRYMLKNVMLAEYPNISVTACALAAARSRLYHWQAPKMRRKRKKDGTHELKPPRTGKNKKTGKRKDGKNIRTSVHKTG